VNDLRGLADALNQRGVRTGKRSPLAHVLGLLDLAGAAPVSNA
jgi:hypothetical protein